MKFKELKDINSGDNIILAWGGNGYDKTYYPYNVIVHKYGPKIELTEPDDEEEIHYSEFFHSKKGTDINGNLIIELAVFDSVKEAADWCDRENNFNEKYNSEYYDCGYDSRTGELWPE